MTLELLTAASKKNAWAGSASAACYAARAFRGGLPERDWESWPGGPAVLFTVPALFFPGRLIGCLACRAVEVPTQQMSKRRIHSVGSKLPRRFATVPCNRA